MTFTELVSASAQKERFLTLYRDEKIAQENSVIRNDEAVPSGDIENIRRWLDEQVKDQEKPRLKKVLKSWQININDLYVDFGGLYKSRRFLMLLRRLASVVPRATGHRLILDAYVERDGGDRPAAVSSVKHFSLHDIRNAISKSEQLIDESGISPSSPQQNRPAASFSSKRRKSTAGERSAEHDQVLAVQDVEANAHAHTGDATRTSVSYDTRGDINVRNKLPPAATNKRRKSNRMLGRSAECKRNADKPTRTPATSRRIVDSSQRSGRCYVSPLATAKEDDEEEIFDDEEVIVDEERSYPPNIGAAALEQRRSSLEGRESATSSLREELQEAFVESDAPDVARTTARASNGQPSSLQPRSSERVHGTLDAQAVSSTEQAGTHPKYGKYWTLDDLPPDVREKWEAVGGLPIVVTAADFICGPSYTAEDLFKACLRAGTDQVSISSHGSIEQELSREQKLDAIHDLAWQWQTEKRENCGRSAIVLLPQDDRFKIQGIEGRYPPGWQRETTVFWALKEGRTHAHIDNGLDVVTLTIVGERDLFGWPGNRANLEVYRGSYYLTDLHARDPNSLEACIRIRLREGQGVFMKGCTIHAVDTNHQGFQIAKNFCHEETIVKMSTYLAYGVSADERASQTYVEAVENWMLCLEEASIDAVIEAWQIAKDPILKFLSRGQPSDKTDKTFAAQRKKVTTTIAQKLRTMREHANVPEILAELQAVDSTFTL